LDKKISSQIGNQALVEQKHKQIVYAASELFSRKGFHSTSMRAISKEAGINLSYLYKYISSKDDILYLFYKDLYEQWTSAYRILEEKEYENPVEKLKAFIRHMLGLIHRAKREVLTMYTESRHLEADSLNSVLSAEKKMVSSLQKIIEEGIEEGYFRIGDSVILANIIQYLLVIEPLRGWNFMSSYTFRRFEDLMIDFILSALGIEER
jgi:AcrR family transcriptional regulator